MYAIIKTGGKQYRVEPGTVLEIDRLAGNPGETITLAESVLMVSTDAGLTVGTPVVGDASVQLEILEHLRDDKIIVFKMKRRKRNRRKHGHRQALTRVRVKEIKVA